jgi:hypothetical protein
MFLRLYCRIGCDDCGGLYSLSPFFLCLLVLYFSDRRRRTRRRRRRRVLVIGTHY